MFRQGYSTNLYRICINIYKKLYSYKDFTSILYSFKSFAFLIFFSIKNKKFKKQEEYVPVFTKRSKK